MSPIGGVRSAIISSRSDIIDNFEEFLYEDQNRTLVDIYNEDTASFSRVNDTTLEGDYNLTSTGDGVGISAQSDELQTPSVGGDAFGATVYAESVSDTLRPEFYFLATSASAGSRSGYAVRLYLNDGLHQLLEYTSDSATVIDDEAVTLSATTEYVPVVTVDESNTITSTLYESGTSISTISGTDSTHTSGEIGWAIAANNVGDTVRFDNYRFDPSP